MVAVAAKNARVWKRRECEEVEDYADNTKLDAMGWDGWECMSSGERSEGEIFERRGAEGKPGSR